MKLTTRLESPLLSFGEEDGGPAHALTVETIDNHVYFYSEVNSDRCLDLIRQLRAVDNNLLHERLSRNLPTNFPLTPIWLHIHSNGGELYSALAASDGLAQLHSPVYSIVEGLAASAATLLSMACSRRHITPSSFMMIHQLNSIAWGSYEKIKDDVIRIEMAMTRIKGFYLEHGKLSPEEIDELLKHDSWFDASKAIEAGLVDEIYVP